jgi:hypothetical protein
MEILRALKGQHLLSLPAGYSFLVREPNLEVLKELTDSRWIVYDVLPTFFSHSDHNITLGEPSQRCSSAVVDSLFSCIGRLRSTSV